MIWEKARDFPQRMQIWEKVQFGCFEQLQNSISGYDGITLKIIFNGPICIWMIKVFNWKKLKVHLLKLNKRFKVMRI